MSPYCRCGPKKILDPHDLNCPLWRPDMPKNKTVKTHVPSKPTTRDPRGAGHTVIERYEGDRVVSEEHVRGDQTDGR